MLLQAFVPRLLQQEKFIFDELVSYVWTHTFVPAVAASRARPANTALAAGVVKRSGQEAALRKWLGALEAVATQLQVLGRDGHVSTLRHQVGVCVWRERDLASYAGEGGGMKIQRVACTGQGLLRFADLLGFGVKRSGQEAALRHWLGALEAVATQLQVLGRDGHVSTLRHHVCVW